MPSIMTSLPKLSKLTILLCMINNIFGPMFNGRKNKLCSGKDNNPTGSDNGLINVNILMATCYVKVI